MSTLKDSRKKPRSWFGLVVIILLILSSVQSSGIAAPPKSFQFDVTPHADATIEWWYANAHVTASNGHRYAVVASFFRTGNGHSPFDPSVRQPRGHYLIYRITDLNTGVHRAYSLCDRAMVGQLASIAPLMLLQSPHDPGLRILFNDLVRGTVPAPSNVVPGASSVRTVPFTFSFDPKCFLSRSDETGSLTLTLGGWGRDAITMAFTAQRPVMLVGGKDPDEKSRLGQLFYYSTTHTSVTGTLDAGTGPIRVTTGIGWFDHQWGDVVGMAHGGWDWWGVQLANGTDILFYRGRNANAVETEQGTATFMDPQGHQFTTHDVTFEASRRWQSAETGITYPTVWSVGFPKLNLHLTIRAAVQNQEIKTLVGGKAIWEGSCDVVAVYPKHHVVSGTSFMELVGYGSAPHATRDNAKGRMSNAKGNVTPP